MSTRTTLMKTGGRIAWAAAFTVAVGAFMVLAVIIWHIMALDIGVVVRALAVVVAMTVTMVLAMVIFGW